MKKIVSIILMIALCVQCISALAEQEEPESIEMAWETEEVGTGNITEPIEIADIKEEESTSVSEEVHEYQPIVHEETIENMFEFPEEDEDIALSSMPEQGGISLFSVDDHGLAGWKAMYNIMFGDDYLKPYQKKNDGQRVTGNTNRLVIEETDLTLPGKNGLDVVIKRKYDNQDYNGVYSSYEEYDSDGKRIYHDVLQDRYIYGFTNTSTGETLYVGFLSEDQLYLYMYNGCYIRPLNTNKKKDFTINGTRKYYYDFEDIASYISDSSSYDWYEYDSSIKMESEREKYEEATRYTLTSRKMLNNNGYLGNDWNLLLPEAYIYRYYSERSDSSSTKRYSENYVGAFRDINGEVHTFDGNGHFTYYKNGSPALYTSSYTPDHNKYLYFEGMYMPKTLYENGPRYNFVIYDVRGLTYYLYDSGLDAENNERPGSKRRMYTVAVKDEYDNMIRYEYGDNYDKITKIIDTYGREINISSIANGKQISYYDDLSGEIKTITYTTETKSASILDNDSPLKPKEISRFTVTNQEGESTIYDSREGEVLNFYSKLESGKLDDIPNPGKEDVVVDWQKNIERIIYPTGAETRYKYKIIYPVNSNTLVRGGVYAVEASYDIVDGKEENHKEYALNNSSMKITKTCMDNSAGTKIVSEYNDGGQETKTELTPQSTSKPYSTVKYTYNSSNYPTKIITDENGLVNTTEYTYLSAHPEVVESENNGLKKTEYQYHYKNMNIGTETQSVLTGKISQITYKDAVKASESSGYYDYYVSTQLTADKKAVEYETDVQGGSVKSKIKYEYDNEGNVKAVKQWTNDTNGDGKLDETDDVILLSSTYAETNQKTKTVTSSVADVMNADGDNEGAVTSEYSYNIYGSPVSQKDSYGTITTIAYDSLNRPTSYNMPNGGTRTAQYNTAQKNTIVTDEAGVVIKYEIDGLGRNAAKYRKDGTAYNKLEEYTYNECGQPASKTAYRTASEGVREEYSYDCFGRMTQKKVFELPSELMYTESYTYENTASEKTVTKTTTAADAETAVQKSVYDKYGRLIKTETISGDNVLTLEYEYDYQGRVTKETDANGNATTYEYGYDGQVLKQTNAAGNSVSTVYDLAGQPVSVTDANGNTTNTEYDKLGRTVKVTTPFDDTVSGETKTYYDKNSNVVKNAVKRSQAITQIEEYKYDNMGNRIAIIANDGETDSVTQYTYDQANRITKMITGLTSYNENPDGGAVTSYSYNSLGYLSQITDPMGLSEIYSSYDYAGNALAVLDKNNNVRHNEYGAYGLKKTYFEGLKETKEYTYNSIGQMTGTRSVNSNGQTAEESREYDAFGRPVKITSDENSVQNYMYDNNSNVTEHELVQDGTVKNSVTYTYNNLNNLTGLVNNDIISLYVYDANGNLRRSISAGVTTNYTYNKANLLTAKTISRGGKTYQQYTCNYFLNGLKQKEQIGNTGYKHYSYDRMGRLTSDGEIKNNEANWGNTYAYDAFGNRVRAIVSDYEADTRKIEYYTYDANNRLTEKTIKRANNAMTQEGVFVGDERYYYDNNGNLTAQQEMSYEPGAMTSETVISGRAGGSGMKIYRYDAFNRMVRYNSGSNEAFYTYNADNLRTSKTVNKARTDFVWNGQNLAAEMIGDSVNTYTYDVTGIHIADMNGAVQTYLKDTHNNVVGLTDVNGNKLETSYDYDAFGNRQSGDTPNPFGYCGEYHDLCSGLIYLRNRYYDPATSRMLSEDPARQGTNWYIYCNNNPLKYIDPSGLTYVIAWSYGKADLEPYTDSQGNVNWTKFTAENSFARAAATRKQELIDMGVPASEIDIQRIDDEADMKSTWEMWAGYDIIEGMNIYSHGYSGGISVAGGGGEFLSDTTKLKWGSMLRSLKVNGKTTAVVTSPYAVFHGCNTANGDFAQNFANTQGVTTYAQIGYASFSQNPTWHIPINDGATGGSVYLYHFNWNNIKNTDGLGKVFYAQ